MKSIAKVVLILTLVMLIIFYEGLNIVYVDNQTHVNNVVDASEFDTEISLDSDGYISLYGFINLSDSSFWYEEFNGSESLKLYLVPSSRVKFTAEGDYFFDNGYIYLQEYDDYRIEIEDIYVSVFYDETGMLSAKAINYSVLFDFPRILTSLSLICEFARNSGVTPNFDDNEDVFDYLEDIGMIIGYPFIIIFKVYDTINLTRILLGAVVT